MFNISKIKYSIMHNITVNLLANKVEYQDKERLLEQVKYHDMDKVLNYLIGSIKTAHNLHLLNSSHHFESNDEITELDLCEMVLDWESARYTKIDKPLNAYQTLEKYYVEHKDKVLSILKKLNLKDVEDVDKEVLNQLKEINLSIEMILDMVIDYINYLRANDIKVYFNLDEIILKIYQCLSKKEQLYFSKHLDIEKILKDKKKIKVGLFTHKNPDYDAIGSTLTIANYISKLTNDEDIEVIPVIQPVYILNNLMNKLKIYALQELERTNIDYAILCDVNEKDRIYGLDLLESVSIDKRYIIDHHDQNREEVECYSNNRIILPQYSSTCEIVTEFLLRNGINIPDEMAYNLYYGIASDTFGFERSVTENTKLIVELLNLSNQIRENILTEMDKMTEEQIQLYNKIKECYFDGEFKIFTLLEPIESGDITKYLKHKEFDKLTGPTKECPVTCFIIGCGNNYFIKLKKNPEYDLDILKIAGNCNGGGHENRCAGRFFNTDFETVFEKILYEYGKVSSKSKPKLKIK